LHVAEVFLCDVPRHSRATPSPDLSLISLSLSLHKTRPQSKSSHTLTLTLILPLTTRKPHTKKTLLNKDVTLAVRDKIEGEMCTIAFLKMFEMLAAYDLVAPGQDGRFNTLHLCEAPGAFICATNHYIKSRFPGLTWDWVACTLNPYFEGNNTDAIVDDDAFINETSTHWFFGKDDSGDMRLPENIFATWERAAKMGPVMLVTADGSVDSSHDPNNQEEVTAQLHFCEAVAAVGALAVGGAFVIKMFTLYEHSSICLARLLSGLFHHTSVCKPTMSTPGNSETYLVSRPLKSPPAQHSSWRTCLSLTQSCTTGVQGLQGHR